MRVGVIMQETRNWNWVMEASDEFRGTEQLRSICVCERAEQDVEEKG